MENKQVKILRNPVLRMAGLAILALVAAQLAQVVLFVMMSIILDGIRPGDTPASEWIPLLPNILATLAGGFFLGRLIPENARRLWFVTAVISGMAPVALHGFFDLKTITMMARPAVWLSCAGNAILWYAACFLGSVSHRKKPDPVLDAKLVRWTAGISITIVCLLGISWGSILLSEGYRLARAVELPLPHDVDEIEQPFFEPGAARTRRFKTVCGPGDVRIQQYYTDIMHRNGWTDVSEHFQSWPVHEWQFREETVQKRRVEYALAGGHWRDFPGNVVVTLVLQGQKHDETADWDNTDWIIHGIVVSRPYNEPVPARETPE